MIKLLAILKKALRDKKLMSFLDYKAKQIEPNAEHQAHHSKTEDLLVNEKSIFVVEYTKKKRIIILDNQEELVVTCKTT